MQSLEIAPRELASHYKAVKLRLNKGRNVRRIPIVVLSWPKAIPVMRAVPIEPDAPLVIKQPTIAQIIRMVAEQFRVTELDIISQRRDRIYTRPRQVVMYLAKMMTDKSFPHIARHIGGRDHTTALHGYRQIASMICVNDDLKRNVDDVHVKLTEALG